MFLFSSGQLNTPLQKRTDFSLSNRGLLIFDFNTDVDEKGQIAAFNWFGIQTCKVQQDTLSRLELHFFSDLYVLETESEKVCRMMNFKEKLVVPIIPCILSFSIYFA